jgi:hypothetical protein
MNRSDGVRLNLEVIHLSLDMEEDDLLKEKLLSWKRRVRLRLGCLIVLFCEQTPIMLHRIDFLMFRLAFAISLGASFLLLPSNACYSQTQTRDGAVLGGVAGAVIGGIVGHQNDETPEGALIGGAVGAIAGGLIGNQQQRQAEQYRTQQYYSQPRYYHQHGVPHYYQRQGYVVHPSPVYVPAQPIYTYPSEVAPTYTVTTRPTVERRGVMIQDVLKLYQGGVSEEIIINHIEANGVAQQVLVDDVVSLSDAGVPENVITALQNAPINNGTGQYARRAPATPRSNQVTTKPNNTQQTLVNASENSSAQEGRAVVIDRESTQRSPSSPQRVITTNRVQPSRSPQRVNSSTPPRLVPLPPRVPLKRGAF